MILTLPVNVIPILGQMAYVFLNGWVFTFAVRFHYDVEIRYISVFQSRKEAWERRHEFTSFGSVAFALEMIPLANLLFVWTNIVGAALWVADEIEKEESRLQSLSSSQSLMGNNDNIASHIVRPEPPRMTSQLQQQQHQQAMATAEMALLQQQHSQHSQQKFDAPPTYTPGSHFTVVPMDGVPQQQQQQYQYPQHQHSFGHQGQSSSSAFAQQGSPRIPPKNKKQPEI